MIFNERYEKIKLIDRGGMAEIYLALDKQTGNKVAIKVLNYNGNDKTSQRRFFSEITLTQKIDSPFVVKIIDMFWSSKIQFYVMEYIEGKTLRDLVRQNGALSEEETIDFTTQIALGLYSMHKQGIIHRDIKSHNIMIQNNNVVKIIDLGIAKTEESDDLTKTGIVIASLQYVAPEILVMEKESVKSDIYSLGILMYYMLNGSVPFDSSDDYEIVRMHKNVLLPKMKKNIDPRLEEVIIKATQKKPSKRYSNMVEIIKEIQSIIKTI